MRMNKTGFALSGLLLATLGASACKERTESVDETRRASRPGLAEETPSGVGQGATTRARGEAVQEESARKGDDDAFTTAHREQARTLLPALHLSNLKEIELGKLAQLRGNSEDVKEFGEHLVKEHEKADKKLVEFASEHDVALVSAGAAVKGGKSGGGALTVEIPQKLKGLQGAGFDRAFATLMVDEHRTAIEQVRGARTRLGDEGALPDLLEDLEESLKGHLERASELARDLAGQAASPEAERARTQQGRRTPAR